MGFVPYEKIIQRKLSHAQANGTCRSCQLPIGNGTIMFTCRESFTSWLDTGLCETCQETDDEPYEPDQPDIFDNI